MGTLTNLKHQETLTTDGKKAKHDNSSRCQHGEKEKCAPYIDESRQTNGPVLHPHDIGSTTSWCRRFRLEALIRALTTPWLPHSQR